MPELALPFIIKSETRPKEMKASDATITEKSDTYRFADYQEEVIELLKCICTVSTNTMDITAQLPKEA